MNRRIIENLLIELNPEFNQLTDFIMENVEELKSKVSPTNELFSEKQTMLITYADQFQNKTNTDLQNLNSFLNTDLKGLCSHVHILPFYPWTSDDGFSAVNYHEVCSDYGTWQDVEDIKQDKMFDCVYNHLSAKNEFFQKAVAGEKNYQDMFHFYSEEEYKSEEFQENIDKV